MAIQRPASDEIIALRDGEPTSKAFRQSFHQDGAMLVDLADARLLALALSLPADLDVNAKWPLPPDEDLASYLLDRLTTESRSALEVTIRGNPRAFKRLLELREALVTYGEAGPTPPPWTEQADRERFGTARVRAADGHLEFSPDRQMRSKLIPLAGDWDFHAAAMELPPPISRKLAGFESEKTSDTMLSAPLRALRLATEELVGAIQVAAKLKRDAEKVRELLDLVAAARELADRTREVSEVGLPGAGKTLSFHDFDLSPRRERRAVVEWRSILNLEGAQVRVEITGTLGHQAAIHLHLEDLDGASLGGRLVTLIRPGTTWQTTETDLHGHCDVPLQQGESAVQIEADRTLELRLRYGSQRTTTLAIDRASDQE